jgi:P27 family predicted phage terminase small subunit
MRGPAPKPTALKNIQGNPGKRRTSKSEPKPEAGSIACPAWLDQDAKAFWKSVAPRLKKLGLLTEIDTEALAVTATAWSIWRKAVKVAATKKGMVESTIAGGNKKSPEVAIAAEFFKILKSYAAEFGMTPASRTRLQITEPPPKDPWEEFAVGDPKRPN